MKASFPYASSSLPAVLAAALALGCGEEQPKQGALMLSVTTDMAVPTDIDSLAWSVTLHGEAMPFASGALNLASGEDFPVTLAIAAGPKTTEPVTIRVEGRKGTEAELLRVTREARLEVPTDRVALLRMPLSWFCSDANLSEPCSEGETCQAGHCVDAAVVTESLRDYEPPEKTACFDLTACIQGTRLERAGPDPIDPEGAPCAIVGSSALGTDANVNVAIEVNNEQVGNYGFCGAFGECFVPLHRSREPEGWQVFRTGDTPSIRLPNFVCETTSVSRVAVSRLNAACPADRGERPLCPPPEDTCLNAEICPLTWPTDAWAGYACSGTASPWDKHPDLVKCWDPAPNVGEPPAPSNGRACCLKGEDPSSDPLVIDDMSAGPQLKLEPGADDIAGWWWTTLADGSGDLSPAPDPSLYTYRAIDPPIVRADGTEIRTAACLSSPGFRGWVAVQGFNFFAKKGTYGATALDVQKYKGISFWGWARERFEGASVNIRVTFPNRQTSHEPGSKCLSPEDGGSRCDNLYKELTLDGNWARQSVDWNELHQSSDEWGQIRYEQFDTHVYSIMFSARGAGPEVMSQPFDFCVADIRFTE